MKNVWTVASRLPQDLVRDLELIERLEQTDRSTTVRKLLSRAIAEWKREYYARRYAEGKVTLARAAREAGVSLWEMMEYALSASLPGAPRPDGRFPRLLQVSRWRRSRARMASE